MREQTSIKINFLMNALLTMSSIIFPLITFPYVSRVLLPEGTGKVAFATSLIAYFNMAAQLGIPTYGIRICAQSRDDRKSLSRNVQELLFLNLFFGLLSSIALIVGVFVIPRLYSDKVLFLIMGVTILLNAIGMNWLFQGLEQYSYITVQSVFFKFVALVAMFIFVREKSDYVIYGGLTIFAASASNIMNFFYAKRFVDLGKYNIKPWRHIRSILIFFAMSVATTIYTNLDQVMLGFMGTNNDVGYYNAAVKVKSLLVALVTSLGAVLLPRSSYYIEHGQNEEFKEISYKALDFVMVFATGLMLYFTLFAKQSIYFLSGEAYSGAILPMQIIMPTLLFIGLSNILGLQILVPLGREKVVLYSEICGAVSDLIINAILIPNYKSAGAAIGTVVAEFIVFIFQYCYLRRFVKAVFTKISYWKIAVSALLSSFIALKISSIISGGLITLLVTATVFFTVYFGMLILLKEQFAVYVLNQLREFRRHSHK